jgi:hypothetical protein
MEESLHVNPWPMERTHLTPTLAQSESVHKKPQPSPEQEPPVSGLRGTALAAAFSFSNKSTCVHYLCLVSLFLSPAKMRTPGAAPLYPTIGLSFKEIRK